MKEQPPISPWGHMSGAQAVVNSLRRAGVKRVFGIPAIETTYLFDAFESSPIEMVLCTHEHSAVFMADAHARATGELSACVLAPGPGLTNAMTGLAEAKMDTSPLLALVAGQLEGGQREETVVDALDQLAMARPLCKRVFRVEDPEEIPPALARAVRLAQEGAPGPVLVEIPVDVQRRRGRMEGTGFRPGPKELSRKAFESLARTVKKMQRAKQVGLYVGAGCFEATEEVAALAELLHAPVATTISGLGCLPFIHPLSVGFGPGPVGSPLAEDCLAQCDLLLAVGCRFSEATIGPSAYVLDAELVHIDIEEGVAGRRVPAAQAITAPARQALRFLLDRLQERPDDGGMRERVRQGKRELRDRLKARKPWRDAVDPIKFFVGLRELMGSDDVLVLDAGHHAHFAVASYAVQAPRSLIAPVDYRAAGFAVPAAVAIKLAKPDYRVVACVGDGGFLKTCMELLTARRCNASPVVVVFADGKMDLLRAFQERVIGRETCVDLVPVNYEQLALALGVGYLCIRHDGEIEEGLRQALTMEKPVVVECRVAYRELSAYLEASRQAEVEKLPRATYLRVGARLLMRKILGR
ncbi:MAG: thiamine pyrophosphate-binding protein [Deltaproteobacteria bacterium]|nr:thiamine pyrophosphate-binding protein [Deltaproteobacteria bacterium]